MGADYDFLPSGLRLLIEESGVLVDRTEHTSRKAGVHFVRPRPGQHGTMDMGVWSDGSFTVADWARVCVDDPYMTPGGLYPRYFAGWARPQPRLDGNLNLSYVLDCVDYNWRWKNPPRMPVAKFRVGAAPVWVPNHPYAAGDEVQPDPANLHKYTAGGSGTSGATQPAFPTSAGGTVVDNDITWTESGSSLVSDVAAVNAILDVYFPQSLFPHTRTQLHSLVASIPSVEITEGMTADDALKAVAACAVSTTYYVLNAAWAASTVYAVNDRREPTVVNGLVYKVQGVSGDAKSGAVQPTWPTVVGQTVVDNHVTWVCASRIGRWAASVPMVAGQRVEPDASGRNGYYYDVIVSGTTAASPPGTWTTTLGGVVVSGGVTFVCMGRTTVIPVWQWLIPSDNIAHTASWDASASWRNSNSTGADGVQMVLAAYSDQMIEDSTHIHYSDISVVRDGDSYRNAWGVFGQNGAYGYAQDDTAILGNGGFVVAGTQIDDSDTGPTTNEECIERATQLLARSIMHTTLQVKSTTPLDPVMLQTITLGKVENSLLGLDPSFPWPLTNVSVAMGEEGVEWDIAAGDPFLTTYDDPYAIVPGGPEYLQDVYPPALVTYPGDWVLENVGLPDGSAYLHVKWLSGNEGDLAYFRVWIEVAGEGAWREVGQVFWPTQDVLVTGLPQNVAVIFHISSHDRRGNVQHNPDGSIKTAESASVTTNIYTPDPPSALTLDTSFGVAGYEYSSQTEARARFTFTPPAVLPDHYVVETHIGINIYDTFEIRPPEAEFYTHTLRVGHDYSYRVYGATAQNVRSLTYASLGPLTVPDYVTAPPTNLHIDTSYGQNGYTWQGAAEATVQLAWDAPGGAGGEAPDRYSVWMLSQTAGVPSIHISLEGTVTTVSVPNLVVGAIYGPRVYAVTFETPSVGASIPNVTVPQYYPPPPTNLLVDTAWTFGSNGIWYIDQNTAYVRLKYNAPASGAPYQYVIQVMLGSYLVYEQALPGNYVGVTTHLLAVNSTYTYKVYSEDVVGNRSSTPATLGPLLLPPPSATAPPSITFVSDGHSAGGYYIVVEVNHATLTHIWDGWAKAHPTGSNGNDHLVSLVGQQPISPGSPGVALPVRARIDGLASGTAYELSAQVADNRGVMSDFCTPITHTILPVAIRKKPPVGWRAGHPDSGIAEWTPVLPAVGADFLLDTSQQFEGGAALRMTLDAGDVLSITSPHWTTKAGEVRSHAVSVLRSGVSGPGSTPSATAYIRYFAADDVTQVGSDVAFWTGAPSTAWSALARVNKTAPSGAYSFGYVLKGDATGAGGAYNLWWSYPLADEQVDDTQISDVSGGKLIAHSVPNSALHIDTSSTDPFYWYDDSGAAAAGVYYSSGATRMVLFPVLTDNGWEFRDWAGGIVTLDGGTFEIGGSVGNGNLVVDGTTKIGSTGTAMTKVLSASATLDFPSTAGGNSSDLTVTVTGAADGDCVWLGVPNGSIVGACVYFAWVSAANTVTVRFLNNSALNANPASGSFRVAIVRF